MNIPYQNMEIEQIYTQLLATPKTSLAVCSAEQGEGVTSLAFALAQRCLLAGHSTLLVDLNLYRPAIKGVLAIDTTAQQNSTNVISKHENILQQPQLVFSQHSTIVVSGVVAPTKREHVMRLRQPGILEQCIEQWLQEYDTVIIDSSPLNRVNAQNIPAERVAAACHGALLTVLAGKTSEASVHSAVSKLNNANAQLLGSVFNDRDNPSLKNELLREIKRIPTLLSWLSRPLTNMIKRSRFLTFDI
ncbi:chromosome partitioning ATPase [Psychromonas marina]|uniref:Chromosome partitioning ATPase n=1 Tax=Psychromonas marina TaxID=88364 RepID=A0ABQ6E249_9GAMM|nr:hypothetical protein [Psychromonas marina]GLS91295.1 chromosome partitioning ATPase [Psychromonas marina]